MEYSQILKSCKIITQQELLKPINILIKPFTWKAYVFQSKLETFTKLKKKKKNSIDISVFGYENKEKYPI